jgi:S1-C subfamily serine protease
VGDTPQGRALLWAGAALHLAGGVVLTKAEHQYFEAGATLADSEDGELAGVRVTEVEVRSPAWKAGLRKNDLIVSINRQRVKNIDDVRQVVSKHSAGVLLQIKRGDSALFLAIR